MEDGLVHVDIALSDYKLALFLENALEPSQGKAANSYTSQSDGTTLNGYIPHMFIFFCNTYLLTAAQPAVRAAAVCHFSPVSLYKSDQARTYLACTLYRMLSCAALAVTYAIAATALLCLLCTKYKVYRANKWWAAGM